MEEQEKTSKILSLVQQITKNYFNENIDNDIFDLKKKLREFVSDPLFSDDLIYQLRREMSVLDTLDDYLWKSIEEEINDVYSEFVQRKSYLFEGKIREYERRLVDIVKEFVKGKGQTDTFSTVISYLLFHENGLTQHQLRVLTGFSAGSISNTLKIFDQVLVKSLIKGTRTFKYSLNIPGGNMAQLALRTSNLKKKTNDEAVMFVQEKLDILSSTMLKDKKGRDLLLERTNEIMNYLFERRDLINEISKPEFMDRIIKKLE
jgi:DNA-binding transcriptional regulator GbsR (MarR family)